MRSAVAALAFLCTCMHVQHGHAFSLLSPMPQQRPVQALASSASSRLSNVNVRPARSTPAGALSLTAGVYGVVEYKNARRPENAETTKCACGSGLSYAKCCEEWHDRGEAIDPLVLAKSRYSAFAYRLPEYIMATTLKKSPEWQADEKEWEEELLQFCNSYDFVDDVKRLGLIIEECKFQNDNKAQLLFKALMLNKEKTANKVVELWEKSTVVRDGNAWLYYKGSLEEYSGPLQ